MPQVVNGVLYGADEKIARWVSSKIPHGGGIDVEKAVAMGIMAGGKVVAGCVWHNFRGHDIEAGLAADSPRWCRRATLRQLFTYPFLQLGCVRVTALTGSSNTRMQRFLEGIGFKPEGCVRQGFVTEDALIFGMLRAECKWID